jgi:Chondroitinase B/Concanavalin A-like lectin/glucanases superfamily
LKPVRLLVLSLPFTFLIASGATYRVGSLADLTTRINSAVPGDQIILSNGVYTSSSALNITKIGTSANPIVIQAETIGGAEISGTKGFTLSSPAAYITVQGFKFTHSGNISISSGTSHCRFTRNIIQLTIPATNDVSYININGDDVEIDRNELRNKSTLGEMLDIAGSGSQVARRLWVHHNYFHDFTSPGGNGAETIRWGLSGLSLSTGNGLCEYNLFVRCDGENEMISNKSSGNTYRYNTVLDCVGGEISQRHGNDCLYYGNYMRNTAGIRVYGDRHKIFSNYLESNSIGVNMGNGDGDVYAGDPLTSHDRPDDNMVEFNTFVNNSTHYQMGGRTGGLGSSNNVVANNIFQGGGSMASISSSAPYTGTFTNNIRWQTSSAGNMPASGYVTVNPLLAPDASGILHLQPGSPALNAGVAAHDYYGTLLSNTNFSPDMDAQTRDATPDIGADEISGAPILARFLTTNDVGPYSPLVITNLPPNTNSLIAYLAFNDGTANDSSGNSNDGTLMNGAAIVSDATRGKVLVLDGIDDYVDLGNGASLDLSDDNEATIAAWVKVALSHNHNTILSKGEWKDCYSLLIKGDTTPKDQLWTGNDTSVFSGSAISTNVWTHVAVTINGSLANFYINGQLAGAANQNRGGLIDNTTNSVCLGREQYSGSLPAGRWFFNGELDDVRLYNRVLSPAEIQSVVVGSVPPQPYIAGVVTSNGNLVFAGTNGMPNASYVVLTSTNLALPVSNWTPIATNQFDAGGYFSCTNAMIDSIQQFYLLRLP